MSLSRRSVLAAFSTGVGVGMAGCLTENVLTETSLRHLILYNESDDEQTIHLLVEADDEPTHRSTTTVPASDNPPSDAVQVPCDWPMEVSS